MKLPKKRAASLCHSRSSSQTSREGTVKPLTSRFHSPVSFRVPVSFRMEVGRDAGRSCLSL